MRPHRFKAILLDLDGTLLETAPDLGDSLNRILRSIDRRPLSEAEVRSMIGDGLAKLLERGLAATGGIPDQDKYDELLAAFMADYTANSTVRTRPNPNTIEFCTDQQARGVRLAVVTNKPVVPSKVILDANGFTPLLTALVGGDSASAKKPDPAPVRLALRQMEITTEDAVMIGDSPADVGAARAAGIPVAAYRHGYTSVPVDDLGADLVFDDFAGLNDALTKL
ncbi:MAG: HAD-IA family hydrolase [Rhodospirillales bacterium]